MRRSVWRESGSAGGACVVLCAVEWTCGECGESGSAGGACVVVR